MNPQDFLLEHWKVYQAYMDRKERLVQVATTAYLAFVSALVLRDESLWVVWRDRIGWTALLAGLAIIVIAAWWLIVAQMRLWTSAARMCNACQSLLTMWLTRQPSPGDLQPVRVREFARVKLPKALRDEMERRTRARKRASRRKRLLSLAKFDLIVYTVLMLWTVVLAVRLFGVLRHQPMLGGL